MLDDLLFPQSLPKVSASGLKIDSGIGQIWAGGNMEGNKKHIGFAYTQRGIRREGKWYYGSDVQGMGLSRIDAAENIIVGEQGKNSALSPFAFGSAIRTWFATEGN